MRPKIDINTLFEKLPYRIIKKERREEDPGGLASGMGKVRREKTL